MPQNMTQMKDKFPGISTPVALVMIILASLCFSNSYNGRFVFDDSVAIVNNPNVKDSDFFDIFVSDFWGTKLRNEESHGSYRPFTIITFRFQYWLRGYLDPMDFHLFNIVLHTIVCILTFFIFKLLLNGNVNVAFYGALLFAVHPCHTEAVSGIVGRADVLSALYMWLSIISYNYRIFSPDGFLKKYSIIACLVFITAAMLSKEIGITAIGIIVWYDIMVVNESDLSLIIRSLLSLRMNFNNLTREKLNSINRLCWLIIGGIVIILSRLAIVAFKTPTFKPIDNPAAFVDNFFYRIVNYNYIYSLNAWLLVCPEWLCFDWSMGCVPLIQKMNDPRITAALILWILIGAIIHCAFFRRKNENARCVGMALCLMIVPFLPASNVFVNVGFVIAERTLYIPSAGYCLLIALGFQNLVVRFPKSKIPISLYAALIVLYFTRSWTRSNQWREEKLLFHSALGVCSLNAKVHYNVAKNSADSGNTTIAEMEYKEALRLNPNYAQAMNNLGNLMKDDGNYKEAEKLLRRAVELQDDFATAWMNLGIVLSSLKKYDESERSYKTALSHRSLYPDCHYNLGVLAPKMVDCRTGVQNTVTSLQSEYVSKQLDKLEFRIAVFLEMKENEKALSAWKETIRQKPKHRRAWINRIRLLDDMGKSSEAIHVARNALQFIPEDATVHFNIANILGKEGQFEGAKIEFEMAISKDPTNPTFLANLGVLYHRWKKYKDAEVMYKKALAINPNLENAKINLLKLSRTINKQET